MKTSIFGHIAKSFLLGIFLLVTFACVSKVTAPILQNDSEICRLAYVDVSRYHSMSFDAVPSAASGDVIRNISQSLFSRIGVQNHHSHHLKMMAYGLVQKNNAPNSFSVFAPSRPALGVIWPIYLHHLII